MFKSLNYVLQSSKQIFIPLNSQKRLFWEYVNMMFNTPDLERIKKFGPDRTCAEWILRNGGKIKWADGKSLEDYNLLPTEGQPVPKIVEIDASDSGISHYGFSHLINCTMVKKIILHNADYIDDRALKGLQYAKDSLTHLQVSKCASVTDAGLKELKMLQNLESLFLFSLASVDNLEECRQNLQASLPKCKIEGAVIVNKDMS